MEEATSASFNHLWLANGYQRLVAISTSTKFPNALHKQQSELLDLLLRYITPTVKPALIYLF